MTVDIETADGAPRSRASKLFDVVALAPFPVALALVPDARHVVGVATVLAALSGYSILFPRLGYGWTRTVPPLLYCVAVALLRDVLGGPASGLGLLLMLPVCGLALHGTRAQLGVVLAGTTAALAVPILILGAPTYPAGEWIRTLVWVGVAPIVGLTVQDLVGRLRNSRSVLSRVASTARHFAHDDHNRASVCHAARTVSQADLVFLLEPDTKGELRSSADTGEDQAPMAIPMQGEPCRAVTALASGNACFVPSVNTGQLVSPRLVRSTGAGSVLYQPILRGDAARAVLVLVWGRPLRRLPAEIGAAMGLLAAEASVAMERADLLATMSELAHMDP
ncbi:MAG: GAF domain-containing protein, partial [Actinomycetota bacterium]|nr:GAF domain-containing protein [Actinomycetota bacterium]